MSLFSSADIVLLYVSVLPTFSLSLSASFCLSIDQSMYLSPPLSFSCADIFLLYASALLSLSLLFVYLSTPLEVFLSLGPIYLSLSTLLSSFLLTLSVFLAALPISLSQPLSHFLCVSLCYNKGLCHNQSTEFSH